MSAPGPAAWSLCPSPTGDCLPLSSALLRALWAHLPSEGALLGGTFSQMPATQEEKWVPNRSC